MTANQAPSAGVLYDVINGQRQDSAAAPKPEGGAPWLPMENESSRLTNSEYIRRSVATGRDALGSQALGSQGLG